MAKYDYFVSFCHDFRVFNNNVTESVPFIDMRLLYDFYLYVDFSQDIQFNTCLVFKFLYMAMVIRVKVWSLSVAYIGFYRTKILK